MAILAHPSPVAATHHTDLAQLDTFPATMRSAALTLLLYRYLVSTYPEHARRWISVSELCEHYGIGSQHANSIRALLTERSTTLQAMRVRGMRTSRFNTIHLLDVHAVRQGKRTNGIPVTRYKTSWHRPDGEPKIGILSKKSEEFLRAWYCHIFETDKHNAAPQPMKHFPGEIYTVLPFRYSKKPVFPSYQPPAITPKRDPDGRYFGCGLCGYEWKSRLKSPLIPKKCPMCKNHRVLPLTAGDTK